MLPQQIVALKIVRALCYTASTLCKVKSLRNANEKKVIEHQRHGSSENCSSMRKGKLQRESSQPLCPGKFMLLFLKRNETLKYYCQRKACKIGKTSTEGGRQNYFLLTS